MLKYWLWPFLATIVAVWGGNLWYYESQKLERPLFLMHYYEIPASLFEHMSLYFVTNNDVKRVPFRLELPNGLQLRVERVSNRDEKGRLQLCEAIVSPQSGVIDSLDRTVSFDRLRVYYDDGLVDTVRIGEIIVHPNPRSQYPLQSTHSKGWSDDTGSVGYIVRNDVAITSVTYSFPNILNQAVDVRLNGHMPNFALFPLKLRADDSVQLDYSVQLPDNDFRRFHAYQLRFALETANGEGEYASTQIVNIQPKIYGEHLLMYIRQRKQEPVL
ncbi:hypothetical protein [Paenibacillus hamazuiensis]|uniref:hypothetical protein n=1 Tax=Paenibacillus hamazuiensis TaxID=2936508 RepID=UPI00200E834B|nr:hypothetical protein [Paenibacillus hamazuiensis]